MTTLWGLLSAAFFGFAVARPDVVARTKRETYVERTYISLNPGEFAIMNSLDIFPLDMSSGVGRYPNNARWEVEADTHFFMPGSFYLNFVYDVDTNCASDTLTFGYYTSNPVTICDRQKGAFSVLLDDPAGFYIIRFESDESATARGFLLNISSSLTPYFDTMNVPNLGQPANGDIDLNEYFAGYPDFYFSAYGYDSSYAYPPTTTRSTDFLTSPYPYYDYYGGLSTRSRDKYDQYTTMDNGFMGMLPYDSSAMGAKLSEEAKMAAALQVSKAEVRESVDAAREAQESLQDLENVINGDDVINDYSAIASR